MKHLKRKEFDYAIKLLRGFEIKEAEVRAIAATNFFFMYFLERNLNLSEDYADIAAKNSRYNDKDLANKVNCSFINIYFTRPK